MIRQANASYNDAVRDLLDRLSSELIHAAAAARRLDDMASRQLARGPQSELQALDALTQHLEQLSAFTTTLSSIASEGVSIDIGSIERAASSVSLSALAARLVGHSIGTEPVSFGDCELW